MAQGIEVTINGKTTQVEVDGLRTLLSVLRDELDLTGTKYGCGEGQCGACTVLVDGKPTRSCITAVKGVAGKKITTIEGLEQNGKLHPLQEAFLKRGAMQCAYCTSGMIMTGYALLQKNVNPADAEIVRAMNGNICRCGTYSRIMAAIKDGAQMLQKGGK